MDFFYFAKAGIPGGTAWEKHNSMELLFIASGGLTLFFIVLLLSKREKNRADRILIGWFFVVLIHISGFYVIEKGISAPFLLELSNAVTFLHGPALWWYTLALTRYPFHFRWWDSLHLLPFAVALLLLMQPFLGGRAILETTRTALILPKFLSVILYIGLSLWQLRRHQRRVPQVFSYKEEVELNWLRFLIYGFLAVWLVGVVSMIVHFVGEVDIPQYGGLFLNIAFSLFVIILGYFGFRQTTIFIPTRLLQKIDQQSEETEKQAPEEAITEKYQKSGLDGREARQHYERLMELMETEAPYLDKELTLIKLADKLDLSPNHLSQIINTFAGQHFFDFINRYRVEAVKRKIEAGAHKQHTLLGIALDCGFNSKASFNRAFRKFTGQTPSAFGKTTEEQRNH